MHTSKRYIKRLAYDLEKELQKSLSIMELPDDSFIFRGVIVKQLDNDNWGLVNINSKDIIDQFFLRTTALLAADAYSKLDLCEVGNIKRLDTHYWSHTWTLMVIESTIKKIKNKEKYLIALNKMENNQMQKEYFGNLITNRFRHAFIT